MVEALRSPEDEVTIALVGKYIQLHDAYISVVEALKHGGISNRVNVNIKWVDSELVTKANADEYLSDVDGILVPGGFGDRGIDGKIQAISYARTHNIPYLGLCLGMQLAIVEYARNVLGYSDALFVWALTPVFWTSLPKPSPFMVMKPFTNGTDTAMKSTTITAACWLPME